jgi:hypothetical protein
MKCKKCSPDLTATKPHARAWQRMLSAGGSICSIPLRSMSSSRTSRMVCSASRAGTDRPCGAHIFRWRSNTLLVDAIVAAATPRLDRRARSRVLLHDAPIT